jgi:hypothetical protein
MQYQSIILLTIILCAFGCAPTERKDFEAHGDCLVYSDEVISESIEHGHVDYIDLKKASDCSREELKNLYLFYYDSTCIAVYNEHPKLNYKLIESFIRAFQTDTTRLSEFIKFDSSISITVSRLCEHQIDNYYRGKYVDWRRIEYSTLVKPFVKTKDDLITTWCNWME